jgi:hypothetical protein
MYKKTRNIRKIIIVVLIMRKHLSGRALLMGRVGFRFLVGVIDNFGACDCAAKFLTGGHATSIFFGSFG